MFRIVGYTGDVDVPDLPDMDIDNDIADLTYEDHYQRDDVPKPRKKLVAIVR